MTDYGEFKFGTIHCFQIPILLFYTGHNATYFYLIFYGLVEDNIFYTRNCFHIFSKRQYNFQSFQIKWLHVAWAHLFIISKSKPFVFEMC